jgi:serpin B
MHSLCNWIFLLMIATTTMASAADIPATRSADMTAVASNHFAVDLYSQLRQTDGNICISPYSITNALDMASAGAAGKTQQQMLSVLHWTGSADGLPVAAATLTAQMLKSSANGPKISIANALFSQSGYPFRQPFLDVLARQYHAPLQKVDFNGQPTQACDQINQWVKKQTHDLIPNAMQQSAITPLTRLVLVDAIYFKAKWQWEFLPTATEKQPFFVTGKEPVTVPLMSEKGSFDYMENDSLQAVSLPYIGDYSMVILLPKKREGLADLESSLTAEGLSDVMTKLTQQEAQVYLPKFKMQGEYQLVKPLANLGMTDAFNSSADFSAMTSAEKLYVNSVIHKTYIAVDEAGTEAAALTAMAVGAMAMRVHPETQPMIFRADHPFLFVLRHRPTGAILFLGRISNPQG